MGGRRPVGVPVGGSLRTGCRFRPARPEVRSLDRQDRWRRDRAPHPVAPRRVFRAIRAARLRPTSVMAPVVHRVDQLLGGEAAPARCWPSRRACPTARASAPGLVRAALSPRRIAAAPEVRKVYCPVETSKRAARLLRASLRLGLPHDIEDLQQALLVGGVHRFAAGPEVHAAPRHVEEPSDLLPSQSGSAAQLRDRAARQGARS